MSSEPASRGLWWLAPRSALGAALGALAGAVVALQHGARSEWHLAALARLFVLAVGLCVLAGSAASARVARALAERWSWTEVSSET